MNHLEAPGSPDLLELGAGPRPTVLACDGSPVKVPNTSIKCQASWSRKSTPTNRSSRPPSKAKLVVSGRFMESDAHSSSLCLFSPAAKLWSCCWAFPNPLSHSQLPSNPSRKMQCAPYAPPAVPQGPIVNSRSVERKACTGLPHRLSPPLFFV